MLDNGLCLCAKAFRFQTNLVIMSSMERKRKIVTIETKLETIDQLAIGVRVSFLAVHDNLALLFNYPKKSIIRTILGPNWFG